MALSTTSAAAKGVFILPKPSPGTPTLQSSIILADSGTILDSAKRLALTGSPNVVAITPSPMKSPTSPPDSQAKCKRKLNFAKLGLPLDKHKSNPKTVEKRNARERNRVKTINTTFDDLRDHLPCGDGVLQRKKQQKMSKVDILKGAIDYISMLKDLLEDPGTGSVTPSSPVAHVSSTTGSSVRSLSPASPCPSHPSPAPAYIPSSPCSPSSTSVHSPSTPSTHHPKQQQQQHTQKKHQRLVQKQQFLNNNHIQRHQMSSKNPYEKVSSKNPYEKVSSKNPYEKVSSKNPYEKVSSKNPYEKVSSNNPYENVSSKNPYEKVSSTNLYENVSSNTPYENVSSKNPYEHSQHQQAYSNQYYHPSHHPHHHYTTAHHQLRHSYNNNKHQHQDHYSYLAALTDINDPSAGGAGNDFSSSSSPSLSSSLIPPPSPAESLPGSVGSSSSSVGSNEYGASPAHSVHHREWTPDEDELMTFASWFQ